MSGPEDFTSFADYMGLNNEAGQAMLKRTQGNYAFNNPTDDGLLQQSQNNLNLSRRAGEQGGSEADTWNANNQYVQKGMASYGEFMAGMNDPAKRQALMEKTYGKGAASWLDSAVAGSDTGAADRFASTKQTVDAQAKAGADRFGAGAKYTADIAAGDARGEAAHQARMDAQNQMLAKRSAADRIRKITAYGKWWEKNRGDGVVGGGFDPYHDTATKPGQFWEGDSRKPDEIYNASMDNFEKQMNSAEQNMKKPFKVDAEGKGYW